MTPFLWTMIVLFGVTGVVKLGLGVHRSDAGQFYTGLLNLAVAIWAFLLL